MQKQAAISRDFMIKLIIMIALVIVFIIILGIWRPNIANAAERLFGWL